MEHIYEITGINCQSCVDKVKAILSAHESITEVAIDKNLKEVTLKMDKHVRLEDLNKALKSAGNYSLKIKESVHTIAATKSSELQSLRPLFIILAYIVAGALIAGQVSGNFSLDFLMRVFMGGFFVLFSLFKMIDLSGFADGYSTYDILAKRSRLYALTYPFIELGLGAAFLLNLAPVLVNIVTLIAMGVGAIGVAKALLEKRSIQCACLGTALKLPMTKVTLAEDLVMGLMAVGALLGLQH